MKYLPKARSENIVVQNLEDEVLVYDLTTNRAFCLNETSAKVFNACDSKTTFEELKAKHQLTDEIIYLALDGLKKENLIIDEYFSPFTGMNRREVIKKVGLASMVTLPIISAMIAPTAAFAASNCVNTNGQAPNTTVRTTPGGFAGCYADCSAPTVTARCCSNSARATMLVCDAGPPERTSCLCN